MSRGSRMIAAMLTTGILCTATPVSAAEPATAVFAGGCFWCMEPPFDALNGVLSTTSGYAGGAAANPTYAQVSAGGTGHAEAVKVVYDPDTVAYERLLEVYWHAVDPFSGDGQFCDRGSQYRPAIFPQTPEQRQAAEASVARVEAVLGQPVAVTIETAPRFWPAEENHQDYYRKNPLRYEFYRFTCGRDARLDAVWEGTPALDLQAPARR